MELGNKNVLENGLCVSVDYLSFTVKDDLTLSEILGKFGLSQADFIDGLNGSYGYKYRMKHCIHSVSVLYGGLEDMGVHVSVTGSAISFFLECYKERKTCVSVPFGGNAYPVKSFNDSVLLDLLEDIVSIGHLTRLDLAIDDLGCKFYDMDELSEIFKNGLYSSHFKSFNETVRRGKNCKQGHTINLGSRKSALMLRIYDKQAEQKFEKKVECSNSWTRWELELHKERANAVALLLISGSSLVDVAVGTLSNYVRLINCDNERVSRCSTTEKWEQFLNGIRKISIAQPIEEKTLSKKEFYLKRQWAPTMAALYEKYGDLNFVYEIIKEGMERLSPELQSLLFKELKKYENDTERSI